MPPHSHAIQTHARMRSWESKKGQACAVKPRAANPSGSPMIYAFWNASTATSVAELLSKSHPESRPQWWWPPEWWWIRMRLWREFRRTRSCRDTWGYRNHGQTTRASIPGITAHVCLLLDSDERIIAYIWIARECGRFCKAECSSPNARIETLHGTWVVHVAIERCQTKSSWLDTVIVSFKIHKSLWAALFEYTICVVCTVQYLYPYKTYSYF